jgi:hypothetical protein
MAESVSSSISSAGYHGFVAHELKTMDRLILLQPRLDDLMERAI